MNSSNNSERPRKRTKRMVSGDQYFVECVLDERTADNGQREFLIKWENYPESEASWEPRKNIHSDVLYNWLEEKMKLKEIEKEADEGNEEARHLDKAKEEVPQTLKFPNVDCIIADNKHSYLLAAKQDPLTGKTGEPFWCERKLVERRLVVEWKKLYETLGNAMLNQVQTDDFEASPGALVMALYEYVAEDDMLYIKKRKDVSDAEIEGRRERLSATFQSSAEHTAPQVPAEEESLSNGHSEAPQDDAHGDGSMDIDQVSTPAQAGVGMSNDQTSADQTSAGDHSPEAQPATNEDNEVITESLPGQVLAAAMHDQDNQNQSPSQHMYPDHVAGDPWAEAMWEAPQLFPLSYSDVYNADGSWRSADDE